MTIKLGPLTGAVIGIARAGGDDHELAGRICRACVADLDIEGAALSLLTASSSRETLAATDPTAAKLEDLQFTMGEGACIEAAVSGSPVLVPDLHNQLLASRWPMFATAVIEQTEVRALFALPLQLGTINVGVIDLYRSTPGPLPVHELRDALAATDTAALSLLGLPTRTDGAPSTDGHRADGQHVDGAWPWWDGLASDRAEVHQATGMILAQLNIPAQDALVRLRAHAFATSRPLADVARDVVARRLVFTHEMD